MKRVVILLGSPHKSGNTEVLAYAFEEGARRNGTQVQLFKLGEMEIGCCKGCDFCRAHGGECIQRDDMPSVVEAICAADVVVFASPLYFMNLSSQIKTCIDRFYAPFHQKAFVGEKTAALLVTSGGAGAGAADTVYASYLSIIKLLGWTDGGLVWTGGYPQDGSIAGSDAVLAAKELGERLTRE